LSLYCQQRGTKSTHHYDRDVAKTENALNFEAEFSP